MTPHECDQDIKTNRHEFERDEDEQEIDGARHEHQTRTDENGNAVKFAKPSSWGSAGDKFC